MKNDDGQQQYNPIRSTTSEHTAFRTWVSQLSYNDLLHGMEFEFEQDSQDFELLRQMIRLQAPPPTPIHPRAVYYKPASRVGATDGRNEEQRVAKARIERPRLFQLLERTSYSNTPTSGGPRKGRTQSTKRPRFWDVMARRFVTPAGDVLSVGCTEEQREADEELLAGMMIHMDNENKMSKCSFVPRNANTKTLVLRTLHVASRGQFLSSRYKTPPTLSPYFALWLCPSERWFSLPMYLASRVEVALWSEYQWHAGDRRCMKSRTYTMLQDAAKTLNDGVLRRALLLTATKTVLLDLLPAAAVESTRSRDMLLWDLLCESLAVSRPSVGHHGDMTIAFQNIEQTPLVELGSCVSLVRELLCKRLRGSIASELQKALLDDFDNCQDTHRSIDRKDTKTGKKKKKKKRKKSVVSQRTSNESPVVMGKTTCAQNELDAVVPRASDLSRSIERTQMYVTVWSILNDVVERVFEEVGLKDEEIPLPQQPHVGPEAMSVARVTGGTTDANRPALVGDSSCTTSNSVLLPGDMPPQHLRTTSSSGHDLFFSFLDSALTKQEELPLVADLFDLAMPGSLRYSSRDKSAFVDLFLRQNSADAIPGALAVASSTAASLASSTDKESPAEVIDEDVQVEVEASAPNDSPLVDVSLTEKDDSSSVGTGEDVPFDEPRGRVEHLSSPLQEEPSVTRQDETSSVSAKDSHARRSPSPPPPSTPSPQLSPILVSLADLQELRTQARSETEGFSKAVSVPPMAHGSLPNSPMTPFPRSLVPSWSRDDLRKLTLSEELRRNGNSALRHPKLSYRSVAAKAVDPQLARNDSSAHVAPNTTLLRAQSETAIGKPSHSHDEHDHLSDKEIHHGGGHDTLAAKDSASTLGSTQSPREPMELDTLRDERNSFRDMCLTLGAEVARLKNMLAIQTGSSLASFVPVSDLRHVSAANAASSDPDFMAPFFQGIQQSNSIAAMSDAGIPRGDHDSAASEDGTDVGGAHDQRRPRSVHVRHMSSGVTVAESDISIDQVTSSHDMLGPTRFRLCQHDIADSVPEFGMQSRLTKDIVKFLGATGAQLRKQDKRKAAAVQRLTRMATAVWPRAQVKIYGSHVTGLCLPSSDLDFVICLPAVHKNAPAVAPGVLEGRNAINESSQKIFARKLRAESWIDPRSIKLIEHTVVPIVKVATKDTKARMLQLDISFDGPEHHGLAAISFVTRMIQELPMTQPLVLILKQFLLDRGLLTAYTGGLSSYCLFLMVARFLQEQPSWDDCGSLLMAFLDFYGNSFDPRATGISVARRQYFSRPNYSQVQSSGQQKWPMRQNQHVLGAPSPPPSGQSRPDFLRRHSFTENGSGDGTKGSASSVHGTSPTMGLRPPLFQGSASTTQHHQPRHTAEYEHPAMPGSQLVGDHSGRPYTFDPLFVEDPLSASNNVGRNAFRIFQVQRAFSDAHRALVASLEWDFHPSQETDDSEYPLLNCLLQSEDMFYYREETR